MLQTAGHDVVRVVDVLAQDEARVIVTYNAVDFRPMADGKKHAGLLLIYQTNTPKDLNVKQIARAIDNVAQTYSGGIADLILSLNDFSWNT